MKKAVAASVVILALLGSAFSYGILVGRFKVFPYYQLRSAWFTAVEKVGGVANPVEKVARSGEGKLSIETEWEQIEGRKYNIAGRYRLSGIGGGIEKLHGRTIGVDGKGDFFAYRWGGRVEKLNIKIDMNYDEFKNYVDKKGYSDRSKLLFRVLDIEVKEEGGGARLFVFYHFWKSGDKGKVARISSARVDDVEELWEESITSDKWRVIYESSPPVRFGGSNHRPMWSNHTGGRISLRGERSIVASFGDYHMNGVHHERGPVSQDDTSSYGKILEIDIESGKKSIIAKGVRNPQGIYVDDAGKIWETEHGPYGGDELNLIEEGNNYGWPYFTYGRSEGIEWPHQVGAHTEYTRPLYVFEPRTGISNLIRVSGEPSRWDGDFLVSSLAGLKLFRIRIREDRVIHVEPIKVGERVRDLVQTDEGAFVLFADNGRFLELWSADSERPSADIGGEAKD